MSFKVSTRQKSQRLQNKEQQKRFQMYKQKEKNINSAHELLPGLNDISDAFEALPQEMIKYFTLFKEIDAKCVNSFPRLNWIIKGYIDELHLDKPLESDLETKLKRMRNKVKEMIPSLEEKMHITSVATDILSKHMFRINNDYKLLIQNNEIPESIRIGPLNHPAMIMDSGSTESNANRTAHSQRSETRREALAARKANREVDEVDKKKKVRDVTPEAKTPGPVGPNKKRGRREPGEVSRAETPSLPPGKKRAQKKLEEESAPLKSGSGGEPTYCYCNQVSFGEMVGCDGDECKREWFHLPCIGFKNPPKGKWYCDDCLVKMKKVKRV